MILFALIYALAAWLGTVTLAMLAIGAAHAADPAVPALGFDAVAWLAVALTLILGVVTPRGRS